MRAAYYRPTNRPAGTSPTDRCAGHATRVRLRLGQRESEAVVFAACVNVEDQRVARLRHSAASGALPVHRNPSADRGLSSEEFRR